MRSFTDADRQWWLDNGFFCRTAEKWRDAGFDPGTAGTLRRAGINLVEAVEWMEAVEDTEFDSIDIVAMKRDGKTPHDVHDEWAVRVSDESEVENEVTDSSYLE